MSDGYKTYGYWYTDNNGNSLDDDEYFHSRYVDIAGADKHDEPNLETRIRQEMKMESMGSKITNLLMHMQNY